MTCDHCRWCYRRGQPWAEGSCDPPEPDAVEEWLWARYKEPENAGECPGVERVEWKQEGLPWTS